MFSIIVRHWKKLLGVVVSLLLILIALNWTSFEQYWNSDAKTVGQNYIIEFVANILFPVIPFLLGIYFGRRVEELEFYHHIETVLGTLMKLRVAKLITPHAARHLVQTITNAFGNEAVKQQWLERSAMRIRPLQIDNREVCRICSLEAQVVLNKCENCNLNCYAWDLSALSKEVEEDSQIKRIVEMDSRHWKV